jgi:hypothetical protein
MRTEILTFTISLSTYLHSRAPPHHTAVRKPTQDHARTWIARSLFGFGDVRVGADDDDVRGDAFLARHVHLCNGHGSLHHTAGHFIFFFLYYYFLNIIYLIMIGPHGVDRTHQFISQHACNELPNTYLNTIVGLDMPEYTLMPSGASGVNTCQMAGDVPMPTNAHRISAPFVPMMNEK